MSLFEVHSWTVEFDKTAPFMGCCYCKLIAGGESSVVCDCVRVKTSAIQDRLQDKEELT